MGRTLWGLVKIFTDQSHAQNFANGKLLLRRLSHFRRIESSLQDDRADQNEAVTTWLQPHDLVIKLRAPGFPEITITKDDLAAPVSFSPVHFDHLHILCFHALPTHITDLSEGETTARFDIDEQCLTLGEFSTVIFLGHFFNRLKKVLELKGYRCTGRLVEYYDDTVCHGAFAINDAPFRKQKRFSYQKEFRVCIDTNTVGNDDLWLDVGDISDICKMVHSSELNKQVLRLQAMPR